MRNSSNCPTIAGPEAHRQQLITGQSRRADTSARVRNNNRGERFCVRSESAKIDIYSGSDKSKCAPRCAQIKKRRSKADFWFMRRR